jgi:hypothetical protein
MGASITKDEAKARFLEVRERLERELEHISRRIHGDELLRRELLHRQIEVVRSAFGELELLVDSKFPPPP